MILRPFPMSPAVLLTVLIPHPYVFCGIHGTGIYPSLDSEARSGFRSGGGPGSRLSEQYPVDYNAMPVQDYSRAVRRVVQK
jgi:hypothetical protein